MTWFAYWIGRNKWGARETREHLRWDLPSNLRRGPQGPLEHVHGTKEFVTPAGKKRILTEDRSLLYRIFLVRLAAIYYLPWIVLDNSVWRRGGGKKEEERKNGGKGMRYLWCGLFQTTWFSGVWQAWNWFWKSARDIIRINYRPDIFGRFLIKNVDREDREWRSNQFPCNFLFLWNIFYQYVYKVRLSSSVESANYKISFLYKMKDWKELVK